MNPNTPLNTKISTLIGDADLAKRQVYEYKLSLLSTLLNPPEAFVWRFIGVLLILVSTWAVLQVPNNLASWIIPITVVGCSWYLIFRHQLPLCSRGRNATLVITERIVAFEINGLFCYAPKSQVAVRRGLVRTHIISRPGHGDCMLVNEDAVSFDELKSRVQNECDPEAENLPTDLSD